MTSHVDIARLRIEVTDQVDPNVLIVALRRRFAGQDSALGAENDVAATVQAAVNTHTNEGES